ncbi:unnamed protein product [Calypogeia fissa]
MAPRPDDQTGFLKLPLEDVLSGTAGEDEFLLATKDYDGKERDKLSFYEITKTKSKTKNNLVTSYSRKLFLHMLTCLFIVAHLVANMNYLFFKLMLYARNTKEVLDAPWLLLLLWIEFIYFGSTAIAAMDNFLPPGKRPDLQLDGHYYPTVHIFLPCCKEPTDVPVESIRAALKMDYPADRFKVLVLDDGGDDELKAICETMQVETGGQVVYLRRKKTPGVPHHFKCGNMNYGLQHSNSEYVVMMDADMILHPSFLRRLLPHIVNSPDISFVQIPQSYYNLPLGDPLNDSSILGYDKVLVHRDSLGCATCIGTGCIFRRKHLNGIGGFQPQSITEDTTTAYALFREGYRSVYVNEKLQIGLVPWTFEGYIKQRCRWGQGAMQQFTATWKTMLGKDSKLNFILKILYFWHSGYYFLSIVNFILVGTLLGALVFKPKFTVGTEEDSRQQIENLAYNLIFWRLMWTCLWLQVPQSIQSRNRDESHFWWMSPYFAKMIYETFFSYSSTFKFVPTSNVDRNASRGNRSPWMKQLSELKHVRFHVAYTLVIVSVVTTKVYVVLQQYGLADCGESFYVIGVSFFLLNTCAHMMLPVMYILWPTGYKPPQRKSLLKYDADGVPMFNPEDCVPKWYWSVMFYETLACTMLAFWTFVLWMVRTKADTRWCMKGSL